MKSEVGGVQIETVCVNDLTDRWLCWVTGGKMDGHQQMFGDEKTAHDGHQAMVKRVVEAQGEPASGD